jgi:hypothetical protein
MWVGKGKKGGNGDWVKGLKIKQLTLSMGPARTELDSSLQRATIPNKKKVILCIEYSQTPHMQQYLMFTYVLYCVLL